MRRVPACGLGWPGPLDLLYLGPQEGLRGGVLPGALSFQAPFPLCPKLTSHCCSLDIDPGQVLSAATGAAPPAPALERKEGDGALTWSEEQ